MTNNNCHELTRTVPFYLTTQFVETIVMSEYERKVTVVRNPSDLQNQSTNITCRTGNLRRPKKRDT